jgi:hypothetical protein
MVERVRCAGSAAKGHVVLPRVLPRISSGVIAAFLWTLIVVIFWAARRWSRYRRLEAD